MPVGTSSRPFPNDCVSSVATSVPGPRYAELAQREALTGDAEAIAIGRRSERRQASSILCLLLAGTTWHLGWFTEFGVRKARNARN
jgi:hypothetical protein